MQFSVFSNLFLLAQLNKVINSPTLEGAREGKEILANEIGVVFKPQEKKTAFCKTRLLSHRRQPLSLTLPALVGPWHSISWLWSSCRSERS